jgi:hypothetical protein
MFVPQSRWHTDERSSWRLQRNVLLLQQGYGSYAPLRPRCRRGLDRRGARIDRAKEKTPKDPTVREKFNTYRFADYKEKVIDLLMRVARVSIETTKIVEEMRTAKH